MRWQRCAAGIFLACLTGCRAPLPRMFVPDKMREAARLHSESFWFLCWLKEGDELPGLLAENAGDWGIPAERRDKQVELPVVFPLHFSWEFVGIPDGTRCRYQVYSPHQNSEQCTLTNPVL